VREVRGLGMAFGLASGLALGGILADINTFPHVGLKEIGKFWILGSLFHELDSNYWSSGQLNFDTHTSPPEQLNI
jgi:hypothetical protein